jgi:hypothetical protein
MLNFKEYIEERVYRLTSEEQADVHDVVDKYLQLFNKDILKKFIILKVKPEDFYKKHLNEDKNLLIGYINFFDNMSKSQKEIPVYVSFKVDSKDRGLYEYDEDENGKVTKENIILYYYKLKFYKKYIEDALVHELFHAKQPHKIPKSNYGKNLTSYYLDPVEVHNYTSNIIKMIEDEYNEGTSESNEELLLFLKLFAQHGNILPEPIKVPAFLQGKQDFITTLYRNKNKPSYKHEYKRFFSKIYDVYKRLQNH